MSRNQQKIEQVLQSCLDMIESGQETVESVLARYPEFADELRPELDIALWLRGQKDLLNPRPGWVAASKRRVMARYQEELKTEEAPQTGWLGWNPAWTAWFNKRAVQVSVALVLLLSLLVGGNGVVMAAQDSLPGDRLYPIKTALEKVNLAISLDETKEAQLNLEYTQRRMDEFNRLLLEGRYSDIPESLSNLETQVTQTLESLDTAAGQNASETKVLADSLEVILSEQDKKLDSLITVAPDTTRPAIQRAKTVSRSGATATRDIIKTLPSPTPTSGPRRPGGTVAEEVDENPTSTEASPPTKTPRPQPAATRTSKPAPTTAPLYEPTDAPVSTNPPPPPPVQATNTPRPPTPAPTPTDTKAPPKVIPPTNTPAPTATATSTPTIEPSPTNTATPVPPPIETDTPTPEPSNVTPTPTSIPSASPQTEDPATATESPTSNELSAPTEVTMEYLPTPAE